jgi:AraC-like DNA-binding protein
MIFGLAGGDELASAMALPRRTFNRRLAEYGTTFRDVLKTVRVDVAQQLLRETTLPIGDIAGALGYAESSAFVRAFRHWTQTTPGAWRERSGNRAAH